MQTHEDRSHFMAELQRRAEEGKKQKLAGVTAGYDDELELARWKSNGIEVVHRPDDPQGILRISIGGGDDLPVRLDYCTIRGSVGKCIDLLERAARALRDAP